MVEVWENGLVVLHVFATFVLLPLVVAFFAGDTVAGALPHATWRAASPIFAGRDAEKRWTRHVVIDRAECDPLVQNPKAVRAAARSHRAWPTLLKTIVPPGLLDQRRASSS